MTLSARPGSQIDGIAQLLEGGVPEWDVLLITAAQVDRRTRLFKRMEEMGLTLDLGIERDRTGKISREALLQFVGRRIQAAGKTADTQARELILARAPNDLRGLGNELEKLIDYIGARTRLRAEDIETVMIDRGEGWIFDLTRSIGERDAVAALRHLARLMHQGEHPLKLLAVLATELRRLLSARQLLDGELRAAWRSGMSYDQFQKSVLKGATPLLSRSAFADYMCFQRAAGFSSAALRSYLKAVHEADLRLKSTGSPARLVVERLVLGMCGHAPA